MNQYDNIKIMRTKGAKNKKKSTVAMALEVKNWEKLAKSKNWLKSKKKRNNIMKNLQDVLDAVTALSTALDTLITGIGNIKSVDLTPAVDAINAVTTKIQAIQLPTA